MASGHDHIDILWICGSRIVGGAEHTTLQLLELLRGRGYAVGALCPLHSDLVTALGRRDVKAYPAPLGRSLDVRASCAVARALRKLTPDLALVTTSDEWVWCCLAKGRRSQTRLVLVRHMVLPLPWTVRWLADQRADAVVAVSGPVRDSLRGIRRERLHVIRVPSRFPPRAAVPSPQERAHAREQLGVSGTGRWVGFFAGLSTAKGILDVLGAVRQANEQLGPTHLLVCGRKHENAEVSRIPDWAREFHLEGHLHYLGEVEDVRQAMTGVDVVVVPTHSTLGEAMPLVLIEAMACGTPVLGYAIAGIIEVIGQDGESGRLATADDAHDLGRVLKELLADPENAAGLATKALSRLRKDFDPQQTADQYEQLFLTLR